MCGRGGGGLVATRRGLILGCALGLHVFRNKFAVARGASLDQGLGLVDERVWQWITADIADRKSPTLLFQDEVDAPGQMLDGAWLDRASQAHAMIARGTLKGLIFGDGVIVGLAFAVAKPSQEGQRDYDNSNTNTEFGASLHKSPLPECAPTTIVTYPQRARYGTSVGRAVTGDSDVRHTCKR